MKKILRIVKSRKSYGIYDDIKLATIDALKYKGSIYKIKLNEFKHIYVNTPFIRTR